MRSLTLLFLVLVALSEVCGVRWLGVDILPTDPWSASASLLLADWIVGEYRMMDSWTIGIWLLIAGAAWLTLSISKPAEEFPWSRSRGIEKRAVTPRPDVMRPVPSPTAQDLIGGMTHAEWRARVFEKRPPTLTQMSTVKLASKTG
ncbi:MAG: hypothetical protein SGJ19_02575 [Planctomycetia bacterium]|nr:hypothetical protein [Planctomycetia bacterium]